MAPVLFDWLWTGLWHIDFDNVLVSHPAFYCRPASERALCTPLNTSRKPRLLCLLRRIYGRMSAPSRGRGRRRHLDGRKTKRVQSALPNGVGVAFSTAPRRCISHPPPQFQQALPLVQGGLRRVVFARRYNYRRNQAEKASHSLLGPRRPVARVE